MAKVVSALVFLVVCAVVDALHVYAHGSQLHYEHTHNAKPHAGREPKWHQVVPLRSEKAFYTAIAHEPLSLVMFYARWSQPALDLAPELEKQALLLDNHRPSIPVFVVNLEEVPNLGREYQVNSFPSFAVFRYSSLAQPSEQSVPKYGPAIAGYMISLLKDAVATLKSLDDVAKVIDLKTMIPIGRQKPGLIKQDFPHPDDLIARSAILCYTDEDEFIANIHDASRLVAGFFNLFHVTSEKTRIALKAQKDSCILYRRWGSKKPLTQTLISSPKLNLELISWMTYNAIPPLGVFDEESKPLYSMRHKPLLIYFSPTRLNVDSPLFSILEEIGLDDGEFNVTSAQCDPNTAGQHVAHFLGMHGALRNQGFAIGVLVGMRKYRFPDTIAVPSEHELKDFVRAVLNSTWPEFHKSEPASAIRHGTGDASDIAYVDFDQIVIKDTTRDAILLMYRPDDRNSQVMIPIFAELASRLKNTEILVGQMNVMENDYHPEYVIPGTPAVMYAKRTKKHQPIRLTGVARTIENLEQFVSEHATVSLSNLAPSNQTPSAVPPAPANANGGEDL